MGLPAELLVSQPRLKKAAGGGAGKVLPDDGVGGKHREGLLRQQDFAAGAVAHPF